MLSHLGSFHTCGRQCLVNSIFMPIIHRIIMVTKPHTGYDGFFDSQILVSFALHLLVNIFSAHLVIYCFPHSYILIIFLCLFYSVRRNVRFLRFFLRFISKLLASSYLSLAVLVITLLDIVRKESRSFTAVIFSLRIDTSLRFGHHIPAEPMHISRSACAEHKEAAWLSLVTVRFFVRSSRQTADFTARNYHTSPEASAFRTISGHRITR